jgi:hypothetical protein
MINTAGKENYDSRAWRISALTSRVNFTNTNHLLPIFRELFMPKAKKTLKGTTFYAGPTAKTGTAVCLNEIKHQN